MPRLEQICELLSSQEQGSGAGIGEPTHPSFRLWLSTYRSEDVPALVLRAGVKMTNEPPSGLQAHMRRSCISSRALLERLSEQAADPAAAQRLFFGLCLFHAVVEGRRDYGALGWNLRYDFSISDLQITTRQLAFYVGAGERLESALAAVVRLAGDCNYGGRLADERDRRVLEALLEDFCSPSLLQGDFKPQGLEGFTPPPDARGHRDHLKHIDGLPAGLSPELFGLHPNASLAKNLGDMRTLCSQLAWMGEVEGLEGG
jgi:dynein heavy chain